MIIDNSAVMRTTLSDLLSDLINLDIVATAMEPLFAIKKIEKYQPDILIINESVMICQGIEKLCSRIIDAGLPVIMLKSEHGIADLHTDKLLFSVRYETVTKPYLSQGNNLEDFRESLVEKISGISMMKMERGKVKKNNGRPEPVRFQVAEKHNADVILSKDSPRSRYADAGTVIAIGASTGGTELVEDILYKIPSDLPGIVIAIHMPGVFTKSYADRVNVKSRLNVREASDGDSVTRGTALIAPGERHMLLRCSSSGYTVEINNGQLVNRHKPSVDVLFRSVSLAAGKNAIGILCTGMGDDGARGLLEIKDSGGFTIAQDEASSIVWGMPREAIKLGGAGRVLGADEIIEFLKTLRTR